MARRGRPVLGYLEPRLGFAWDLAGKGKSVLRGGYAILVDQPVAGVTGLPRPTQVAFDNPFEVTLFQSAGLSLRLQMPQPATPHQDCPDSRRSAKNASSAATFTPATVPQAPTSPRARPPRQLINEPHFPSARKSTLPLNRL